MVFVMLSCEHLTSKFSKNGVTILHISSAYSKNLLRLAVNIFEFEVQCQTVFTPTLLSDKPVRPSGLEVLITFASRRRFPPEVNISDLRFQPVIIRSRVLLPLHLLCCLTFRTVSAVQHGLSTFSGKISTAMTSFFFDRRTTKDKPKYPVPATAIYLFICGNFCLN